MPNMEDLITIKNQAPGYVHHWIYMENQLPIMIVARYDCGKDKTYRQFRLDRDEWIEGMPPSPYPLYGLDSLGNLNPLDSIFITEGEKCAAFLHQLNWPAVSTVLGSQNPSNSDWLPMRYYKRFIILRDNDKAGISFAQAVALELTKICPKAEIYVVNLIPGLPKGDVIDWVRSTVLRGQKWNGLEPVPQHMVEALKRALLDEIEINRVLVQECPDVAFKPIEARFEGEPIPLKRDLLPVPNFPIGTFPKLIGEFLRLTSHQFSQEPDYASVIFLAALGGLIGKSVHLNMRPGSSWTETANNWTILVGPPSSKKSPIMRAIFQLFKKPEAKALEEYKNALKSFKASKKQIKNGNDNQEYEDAAPILKRYITDDATCPKIRQLMSENPRGIILKNDELKGQLEKLDSPINAGDRSFFMSCWSGQEIYSEDRMLRGSTLNIPLTLTWIGNIPPTALQKYLYEAMGKGSGADGFFPRFSFICYPNPNKFFELPTEIISDELKEEIQHIWDKIDASSQTGNRLLSFDSDAQSAFDNWLVELENDIRSGRHPTYWESHLGKQHKTLAVLVIVFHSLHEAISGITSDKVSLETLNKALLLLKYFEAHALRCYESINGQTVDDAECILRLLREQRLPERFKAHEIYSQGLGGLSDSARVNAALNLLEENNWVISEKVSVKKSGRNAHFWNLHPKAFK